MVHSYTSMVIAGGAMKVMSVIGIAKYLEEKNMLTALKNFVGTSAGSILCMFLAMGYNSRELEKVLLSTMQDEKVTKFEPEALFDIFSCYGFNTGMSLQNHLDNILYSKYKKKNMTFIEFAKQTGKNLVVCVSNLSKERHEFFSVDTTPNFSVAEAVRTSCTIPIMYCPVNINGDLYIDGGIYNNFPIDYFPDHELKDILGVNITITNYQKANDFMQYVRFIFNSLMEKFNKKSYNDKDRNVITMEFDDKEEWIDFSQIKLVLTKEQLKKYIESGYEAAKQNIV